MNEQLLKFLNQDLSPANQVIEVIETDDGVKAKMLGTTKWLKTFELPYPIMLRINTWKNMGGKIN